MFEEKSSKPGCNAARDYLSVLGGLKPEERILHEVLDGKIPVGFIN